MRALESLLESVAIFAPLRADEIGRVARRFELVELPEGETRRFEPTLEAMRLVIVVRGSIELATEEAGAVLGSGDWWGEIELVAARPRAMAVTARRACTLALLDRAGLDEILREFPAVALPLATRVAHELHATIDTCRELAELHGERLPATQLATTLAARRRAHLRRSTRVRRGGVRALFRRLVVQQGQEPPFWMLFGFITAVLLSRAVVGLILHFGLQKQLFALVPGTDPNPMHVHHFNYGLILIGLSGITALFPFGRRVLRVLAFVFGFGCGLVMDEFALFWNLNPSYKNAHLTFAAIAAVVLLQLVYFRRFWSAVARRAWHRLRGTR